MQTHGHAITSAGNPWLKRLRQAARGRSAGVAVAESPHLLHEALRAGTEIERVFVSERMLPEVAPALPPHRRIPLHPVQDRLFSAVATTARSQGVIALVSLPAWEPEALTGGLVLALDGIQDPGNAGTIVRSAEAFGASGVVFLKGSAAPSNPKTLRASAGSLFRVPVLDRMSSGGFLELVQRCGKRLYSADARGGVSLVDSQLSADCAIVIGSETHGVAPVLAAASTPIAIPTASVESLNASIASSIILYEYARRTASR